ncbi:sigma-54 dependent transcriptional regulator [Aestuariibacter halophilus]|uniref:Sigma-54 dependent transcriptional regulator n=1 Tax=Fluctibacter halophilus TaxID=226011 RepID=A0ABS8G9A3_9ALTE|nr:sigma-54 dependent transcriptional regulator [Aestuariibacter halophilus]MCC2617028.1 sigma-54 dependent transcriptional regulator [Aestuariibacter halophilus]
MDKQTGRILLVDDDQDILVAGKLLLKRHFSDVTVCNQPEHIPTLLGREKFDAILLDMNFGPGESSGEQGYRWLDEILHLDPQAVVIMITAHGGVDVAVDAMKRGATDFIAKPWHNDKVLATVSSAVKLGHSRNEADQLRHTNSALVEASAGVRQPIIARSASMQHCLDLVERCAPSDANVLILGENGTGKEVMARAIHAASPRKDRVFMAVDLGAVAESLFESELFGHRKGAFTGAQSDRTGRLQAADGGTLFLDEIGNLPLHLQAKLLSVLAQREVTPLGANKGIPFDVRVIAATNLPVSQLRDEQYFRQDLLFRLNTVELTLPPLRERADDIQPIAEHYLSHYARKYHKTINGFAPALLQQMHRYAWPGNIRELRHAIERAVILARGDSLTPQDLLLTATVAPSNPVPHSVDSSVTAAPSQASEELNLEQLEKNTIQRALTTHKYNISHAAKALGLTRAALYRRMEKHGL